MLGSASPKTWWLVAALFFGWSIPHFQRVFRSENWPLVLFQMVGGMATSTRKILLLYTSNRQSIYTSTIFRMCLNTGCSCMQVCNSCLGYACAGCNCICGPFVKAQMPLHLDGPQIPTCWLPSLSSGSESTTGSKDLGARASIPNTKHPK